MEFGNKYYKYAVLSVIVLLTLIVYAQVADYEFLSFDDNLYVANNPYVSKGITNGSIEWAFFNSYHYFQPLTWLSHMLDCQLFGLNAGRHHLVNLFFHICNAILLFFILHRYTGDSLRSLLVVGLFALHPINVESVAWIAERKNMLSTFFGLSTILSYYYYARRLTLGRYTIVMLFYSLSLLAKPMLITIPFLLMLLDFWPLQRIVLYKPPMTPCPYTKMNNIPKIVGRGIEQLIGEKIPLLLLMGVFILVSFTSPKHSEVIISSEIHPMGFRVANALFSYVKYIWKLILPKNLSAYYPYPAEIETYKLVGSVFFLLTITTYSLLQRKRKPALIVGWLWYMGTLFPAIGIVQAGLWPAMADRFVYVPFIGLFIFIAWTIPEKSISNPFSKSVLFMGIPLIISIYAFCTYTTTAYWKNTFTLFQRMVEVTGTNAIGHGNLGMALMKQGNIKEAIYHYKEALKLSPNEDIFLYNLGVALIESDKIKEGSEYLMKVIRPEMKNPPLPIYESVKRCAARGKLDEVIKYYTNQQDVASNNIFLGQIFYTLDNNEHALVYYNKALALNPDSNTCRNQKNKVLTEIYQFNQKYASLKKIIDQEPGSAQAYFQLGLLLLQHEKYKEAVKYLSEVIRITPDNPIPYHLVGYIMTRSGKIGTALEFFLKAKQVDPTYKYADQFYTFFKNLKQ